MSEQEQSWYAVRTFYRWTPWKEEPYEERITLWQAADLDAAMAQAERDAAQYAKENSFEVLPLTQAFALDGRPGHGSEVYSLLHRTGQTPTAFLDRFAAPDDESEAQPAARGVTSPPRPAAS
ncbi:hypothetical protein [Kitasatospora sp. HPMI-4]|uniref:hypothetical protein n=1 Tax=Kitasatospora sp. HPMI-4 TaxID=3448443 RepID=UPI003F1DBEE0